MQRKLWVRLISTVVAIPLAITTFSTTALADDPAGESWTPEERPSGSIGADGEGQRAFYNGDIVATDDNAVYAANGASVAVIGDVSSKITEHYFVEHDENVNVMPAIISANNGTVTIGGSVLISDESAVGNLTGVEFRGGSTVNISDIDSVIQAGVGGVAIYLDENTHNGSFTANSSFNVIGASIGIHPGAGVTGISEENITQYLPQINVYSLTGNASNGVWVYADEFGVSDDEAQRMEDAVLHHINYIVHSDPKISVDVNDPTRGNATVIQDIMSLTTKYVSPQELAANPDAGFLAYLSSDYDLVVQNDGNGEPIARVIPLNTVTNDGKKVYRVTLVNVFGGLTLNAIRKQIAETTGVPEAEIAMVVDIPNEQPEASSEPSDAINEVPSGAITVSTAVTGSNGAAYERKPERVVSFKMSVISDSQYKEAVIDNIGKTPTGGLLRVETDRMACFDRAMLEAFAKKGAINMEVVFPYTNGKKFRVVIPAGYDINKLLDEKGYCGYLRLLAILGGEGLDR